MAGTHLISGSFIQSGSDALFKNDVSIDGTTKINGIIKSNQINGLNFNTTDNRSINSDSPLPILNVGKSLPDGSFTEWETTVGTTITISASGNFDNFCFIENIDGGEILSEGEVDENTPLVLDNNWEKLDFGISIISFFGASSLAALNNLDSGYMYLQIDSDLLSNSNPLILEYLFDEPTIISNYKLHTNAPSNALTSWFFIGRNNDGTNETLEEVNGYQPNYFSNNINNTAFDKYQIVFTSANNDYVRLDNISLYSPPQTLTEASVWRTIEKGNFNGQSATSFVTKSYDTPGVYEYIIIANNTSTSQTVVKGTTVTVTE